ncbi:GNAT family N-acetyltransferase [Bradyrhizobium sp.]|uniref:GNAT family N-acetyltransferase n=1 Tax=Bradyrhizobium sp. TaxID=376 RepID=UPI003C35107A
MPGREWRQCEILTLHPAEQWRGAGTALIETAGQLARQQGYVRLWLITTNDNVDALRFYQRRGFCLVTVHRGAVDRSRAR